MKRNKFSLSHYKLLSCDMGRLVPLTWYEALPGDTIQQNTTALIRMTSMLKPIMHPIRVRIHHFFVPNRLIWDSWEDFITGGEGGTSTPTWPNLVISNPGVGTILDYLDLPALIVTGKPILAC